MPGLAGGSLDAKDRDWLRLLQRRAIGYFLENQAPSGLIDDRQANHGPRRDAELCSTSATGMGLIAIALASAAPHRLIDRGEAIARVGAALATALDRMPEGHGILPHFTDPSGGRSIGSDAFSTVDASWLLAGGLWASAFLDDGDLIKAADRLYNRVDWTRWWRPRSSRAPGLIRHGRAPNGRFLPCCWDRANGETVLLYALAAGAEDGRSIPEGAWSSLRPFYGEAAGRRFHSADLGLFVFQYGLDLVDLRRWYSPTGPDLMAEAGVATVANRETCRALAGEFRTFRRLWGLSAGDGPGLVGGRDAYRSYAPGGPIDGTAHLTASLASIGHAPGEVVDNLRAALLLRPGALGRYGFSCVNEDRRWVGPDMVGIDAGAAVIALENVLMEDRVRAVFHEQPCIRRGLERLGFRDASAVRRAS